MERANASMFYSLYLSHLSCEDIATMKQSSEQQATDFLT